MLDRLVDAFADAIFVSFEKDWIHEVAHPIQFKYAKTNVRVITDTNVILRFFVVHRSVFLQRWVDTLKNLIA